MPEYADIYGLSANRTSEQITRFLDRFLPSRIESADEYEVPQYSDTPHTVFKTAEELISYCCANPAIVHAIYWRSSEIPLHAEVFFLADRRLILGVSTPAEDHLMVDTISRELCRFLDSEDVFITYEDVPPDSTKEFQKVIRSLDPHPSEKERMNRAHRPIKVTRPS